MAQNIVTALFRYEVKSCRRVHIASAGVTKIGFENDRRLMVVDATGKYVSQRKHPQLARVHAMRTDNRYMVFMYDNPITSTLQINLDDPKHSAVVPVSIHNDKGTGIYLGDEAAAWFTEVVGSPARLVSLDSRTHASNTLGRTIDMSFADGYPILLTSESSHTDLSSRLSWTRPMTRFRPNIVVSGLEPYAEDNWAEIEIGGVRFEGSHPCGRCVMTTIDQETGKHDPEGEPFKTLRDYRMGPQGPMFGKNFVPLNAGRINVGDKVTVLR